MIDQESHPRFKWKPTLVIFIVAISGLIIVNYSLPLLLNPSNQQIGHKITVTNITISVNYKNGTAQTKNDVSSRIVNATVFDVMNETFQITYQTYPGIPGYFITSINSASLGWTYYIDGAPPPVACSLYILNNNSVIEWNQG
jgi:hypothetical protein